MRLHLLMILAFLSGLSCEGQFSRENQFSLKVDKTYKDKIKDILEEYSFSWLNEITPETAVIEYKGKGHGNKIIQMLSDVYPREIISWGPVRVYRNSFTPGGITEVPEDHSVPENNQGMDVEDALQSAYTGKGITIAISDVGFNTDLIDLEKNIKSSLIYNFVDKSANVSQVSFQDTNFTDEFSYITDRGNRVASVIAAVKGNNLCSSGIAYNATLAALKISEVQIERNESGLYASSWTTSDIISRSLVYKLDEIDIFVMAWSLMEPFEILDLLNREAIEYGAKQGRRGRGTIYVVQAGSAGNGLSNNIHTITVAGIGRFGSLPYRAHIKVDASVITSGLTDGRNLTSSSIITTSYNNKCVSSFRGLSAATAQVAGIIALGLEANPNMSLRDVQHLLVKASDHRGLHESSTFKKNGAGIMFHSVLGFGLLNTSVFFNLAKSHSPVPSLIVLKLNQTRISFAETIDVEFSHEDIEHLKEKSLNYVEQILVSIKLKTYNKNMKVLAVSPSGTESVLMDENNMYGLISADFVSTHFWAEVSAGRWIIRIQTTGTIDEIHLDSISVTLYGTHRVVGGQGNSSTDTSLEQTDGISKLVKVAIAVLYTCVCISVLIALLPTVLHGVVSRMIRSRSFEKLQECNRTGNTHKDHELATYEIDKDDETNFNTL